MVYKGFSSVDCCISFSLQEDNAFMRLSGYNTYLKKIQNGKKKRKNCEQREINS